MTPSPDHHTLSYGRYLRQCRLQRGLRIEDLSRELKITKETLTAIEDEAYARFPDTVFIKGFLKAFAKSVGADIDQVMQSYTHEMRLFRHSAAAEATIETENRMFWRKLMLSFGALILLIGLTLFLIPANEGETPGRQPLPMKKENRGQVQAQSEGSDRTGAQPDTTVAPVGAPVSGKQLLEMAAVEETWVKIIIDNQKPKEYSLQPGDRLALEAADRFNILIGNATGLSLFFNRQPVAVNGEKGQVVAVELP
ncbi:helix-turn-helix domain-containing protein [Desulfosudis oleivorans]|uniref:HTH cro/C1-type domain-containing protein n=1 Tax=Desulfosudis oleivorans (strain DSM 6200 / JCM 39069 / Hxd3) TaxID=96561 RepID=A9A0L2_DESOH|nr:helix-turn-helix domain-containing protein [Desulfosudis oleivorans]ABW67512.1 conserved hypothetical protein [Desulfosudis oleivorans Hxd3]